MEVAFFIIGLALMQVVGITPVIVLGFIWLLIEFIRSKAWRDD